MQDLGKRGALHSATTVSYDVEPFTGYGQYATESAFPHADSPLPVRPCICSPVFMIF
jgi:hypothetical protein